MAAESPNIEIVYVNQLGAKVLFGGQAVTLNWADTPMSASAAQAFVEGLMWTGEGADAYTRRLNETLALVRTIHAEVRELVLAADDYSRQTAPSIKSAPDHWLKYARLRAALDKIGMTAPPAEKTP